MENCCDYSNSDNKTNTNKNNDDDVHQLMQFQINIEMKKATVDRLSPRFDTLLRLQQTEHALMKRCSAGRQQQFSGGLRGGAGSENAAASAGVGGAGTSGWGSPPSGTSALANPNVVGSWGVPQTPQQQQQQQQPSQQSLSSSQQQQIVQSVLPPLNHSVPGNVQVPPQQPPQSAVVGPPQQQQPQQPQQAQPTGPSATKNQLEQLNTMREALFSQDGWGCQHVNQDTSWEVPGSPDPNLLKPSDAVGVGVSGTGGPGGWKATINNGTELWEHNLRNGGQPPAPPVQKTPWGHTPSTNLGGTWGEDDDTAETGNVWTGTPSSNPVTPQWGGPAGAGGGVGGVSVGPSGGVGSGGGVAPVAPNVPPGGGTTGMWPAPSPVVKKEVNDWSNTPAAGNWGVSNPIAGAEPREMRTPSADPRLIDPREQMRGDPRGISGRLNGTTEMWGHGMAQHNQMSALNKMSVAAGGNGSGGAAPGQWSGGSLPKDIPIAKPSGWEEPSPPNQRARFDDGTSLWSQRQQQQRPGGLQGVGLGGAGGGGNAGGGLGSGQWKEMPDTINRNMMRSGNTVTGPTQPMSQARGPLGLKPDTWGPTGGGGRNGVSGWEDNAGAHNWEDKMTGGSGGGGTGGGQSSQWGDSTSVWNKNKSNQMWPDGGADLTDWSGVHGKEPPKIPGGGDLLRSDQYRILYQMGYKKEDIELALRVNNLNIDDALEMLKQRTSGGLDAWGRHDDHNSNFDQFPGAGRFPGVGQQPPSGMPFPPNNPAGNLLGPSGGAGAGVNPAALAASVGNLQPLQLPKYLNQGGPGAGGFKQPPPPVHANQSRGGGGVSGPHTLRMLVEQIQMAVQAGHLNPQILNQPLAPQTLVLLSQLLTGIKVCQRIF